MGDEADLGRLGVPGVLVVVSVDRTRLDLSIKLFNYRE